MMLVWGSRYRWTLASTLLYLGFAGWAIGGTGAVIDSLIPINFRFHNTLWVPAHFHTYLLLGVMFWVMAFLAHLLEQAADRPASRLATYLAPALMVVGGYGLVGAGTPPARWACRAGTPSTFPGPRATAWPAASSPPCSRRASWCCWPSSRPSGATPCAAVAHRRCPPPQSPAAPPTPMTVRPPLGPVGVTVAVAASVASAFVFLPPVQDASEGSAQFHHLAHAVQFFMGAALGLALLSTPELFERLKGRWSTAGLVAVIVAPAVMLLAMIPASMRASTRTRSPMRSTTAAWLPSGSSRGWERLCWAGCLAVPLRPFRGNGLMYAAGVSGG